MMKHEILYYFKEIKIFKKRQKLKINAQNLKDLM